MRWADYGEGWPEGFRPCLKCEKMKPLTEFHKHKMCKGGYNSVCKECRKPQSKKDWSEKSREQRILERARGRAREKGWEFSIELEDIRIPDVCPVFGTLFEENTRHSASIDRIDSSQGYVKGNIQIISTRANALKGDATVEEIEALLEFMKGGACEIV